MLRKCLVLLRQGLFDNAVSVFIVAAFYDAILASEFVSDALEEHEGKANPLNLLTERLEVYRDQMNVRTHQYLGDTPISTFQPACLQHGYLHCTSDLACGNEGFYREDNSNDIEMEDLEIEITNSFEVDSWSSVVVAGYSLEQAVHLWLRGTTDQHYADTCAGVDCNPTCTDDISIISEDAGGDLVWLGRMLVLSIVFSLCAIYLSFCLAAKRLSNLGARRSYVRGYDTTIDYPIGIAARHLSYTVRHDSKPKVLLRDVSVDIKPGKLNGILGPSGSGKTTLMNLLANQASIGTAQGLVTIAGHSMQQSYVRDWVTKSSQYVTQFGSPFLENLTLHENLTYSAFLRLPPDAGPDAVEDRVHQVMSLMRITDIGDTLVGGEFSGKVGLSGGQKRRLCIGAALLTEPRFLFLDEATSGLSAADGLFLVEVLLDLCSKLQTTIVMTVHQPRIEVIFVKCNQCDSTLS